MKIWILKTKVGSILCRNVFGYYLWEEDELLFIRDVCFGQTKSDLKRWVAEVEQDPQREQGLSCTSAYV